MAVYADELLSKVSPDKPKETLSEISKGTLTGAALGLTGGALYAYFKKKPYVKSMLIGTFLGGLLSRIFLIPIKSKQTES